MLFGNVEYAVVGGGDLLKDFGGVGLPLFRQRFKLLDGDFQGFHHARSISQRGCGNRISPQKAVDAACGCSYFVLMESEEKSGDRWLRLGDLAPREVIVVRCSCGRSVEYHKGYLQRRHRVPSDTLVYDLQFRLHCTYRNCRRGFRITIFDNRGRGDNSKPRLERVVVAGEKGDERIAWEEVKGLDGVAI